MRNVYPLKCRLRNEDAGVTRVDVYDDIGDIGWFGGLSAQDFVSQVSGVKGALDVHINSGGGDVFDGIAIANAIRGHQGDTATVNDGLAASIASVILQAGKKRTAQAGSMVMIHDAFGACRGDAADMAKMSETLHKVSDNIAGIYASRAGGTAESWRAEMLTEKWYTAEEAVAAGLADEVGAGSAELPPGLDVAAFTTLPGRIAARLREMPVAARPKGAAHPHDGQHSHSHSAYGASGADDDGMHSHAHSHDGDGNHDHSHGTGTAADNAGGTQAHGSTPEQACADLGHQCCQAAASAKAGGKVTLNLGGGPLLSPELLKSLRAEILASQATVNAGAKPVHGDHERWDPDGDGDCDACAEGDTDHDYWSADGEQLQDVPGKPMTQDRGPSLDDLREGFREIAREEIHLANSAVDESAWDGPAAMSWASSQDNPESAFRSICAGEKTTGEPDTQDHWALPHHKNAGPPNRKGVSAALGRLDQTDDLKNKGAAEAHLKAHQSAMGGDDDSAGDSAGAAVNASGIDISGIDLEQLGRQLDNALRGAIA